MTILRDRANMSPERIRIAELAKEDKERRFSSIAHRLTVEALQDAFEALRKDASAGVDGVTYREYAVEVRDNLHKLHDQLKTGKYRAQPLRRIYIPKEDGRQRPISTVLEADITGYFDAIVRSALIEMIEKRISDGALLRLIGKWINLGVIEEGRLHSVLQSNVTFSHFHACHAHGITRRLRV